MVGPLLHTKNPSIDRPSTCRGRKSMVRNDKALDSGVAIERSKIIVNYEGNEETEEEEEAPSGE